MPILRGLRTLNIDDCRKHRKNQGKLQNDPRRIGICEALNETQVLCEYVTDINVGKIESEE